MQEDKSNMAATPPPPSDSEMKRVQEELDETKLRLSSTESANSALLLQMEEERQTRETHESALMSLRSSHVSEKKELSLKMASLQEELESINGALETTREELRGKEAILDSRELEHANQMEKITEELKSLKMSRDELEKERDLAQEEVKSMHGLVEQETASLRFQLSTTNIQLQQNNEARITVKPPSPQGDTLKFLLYEAFITGPLE